MHDPSYEDPDDPDYRYMRDKLLAKNHPSSADHMRDVLLAKDMLLPSLKQMFRNTHLRVFELRFYEHPAYFNISTLKEALDEFLGNICLLHIFYHG